ncbi:hypothetical protein AKJ45_01630 [candidate division MSBL1 archaeon SCGC-AAA261F19]|uniref:ACT domain-containing protein n=2 Tax=candidate division MSBL1 TaxID=215777 RepID=A0A133VAC4_9EURY|nr:hypothetical protein AKJ43_03395 [candidate division MSBL1 archaeon SCGC-AAA261D19]KXB03408.1 hypothetical protein AKJ45_01630 [candidate division MSBL1 archaeon SCGC-AAA261F19]
MSISKATKKVVSRYPFIRESLRDGLVNYRALARKILKEVSEECDREINLEAIVTAARRYRKELSRESRENRIDEILAKAKVSMRGNVGVVTAGSGWRISEKVRKIAEKVSDADPLQIVQGRRLTTVVADHEDIDKVAEILGEEVEVVERGLSSVTVISPKEIAHVPGVIARMTQRLLGESINIVEMMSCYKDTIFILERENAIIALRAMEELIENSEGRLS